jgi:heat shock protein HslJ
MMSTRLFLSVLMAILVAGCAGPQADTEADGVEIEAAGPPTLEELKAATYGPFDGQTVTLVDGKWEGEPFVEGGASMPIVWLSEGIYLTGDLDDDMAPDAVVHLTYSTGGTGNFGYLAVMARDTDGVLQKGLAEIGDRVGLRAARIDSGRVVLDVLQVGREDAMCCPSQLARRAFTMQADELVEVESEVLGVASVETLNRTEWVLRRLSADEDAPSSPEVTIAFGEGMATGNGGCNDFTATVTQGDQPTDLVVGPVAATRMECDPDAMALEQRVLDALGGVNGWGFQLGWLVLSYQRDDTWGALFFEPR